MPEKAIDLHTFRLTPERLSLDNRKRIVEQALVLLEQNYVHVPFKQAMHAVDPVQRLSLLGYRLSEQDDSNLPSELAFHAEMAEIFNSNRDLHTNYLLPDPYRRKVAFLPFLVEEYFEDDEPRYMVSKVFHEARPESFTAGAELLYWNGVPMAHAIARHADTQAGSKRRARTQLKLDAPMSDRTIDLELRGWTGERVVAIRKEQI